MKKKIIILILIILSYAIFVSCSSCTSGSAQPYTMSYKTDTTQIRIEKEILPIEIDTTWKEKSNINLKKLEKTQLEIKEQHKKIDSLLTIRQR